VALSREARAFVDQLQSMGDPVETLTPEQARRASDERRAQTRTDRTIDGPAGPLGVRIYRPAAGGHLPVVVFFHGGGWVLCDLDSHDPTCRTIANGVGCVVVSVDYRRAPENRYPAAVEDAYAATQWVAGHAEDLVMGDSAGGNLAAVVALASRDRGGPPIACQVLLYPVTDHDFETGSYRAYGEDHYVTAAAMRWYWDHYAPEPIDRDEPYLSPLRAADLRSLPPTLIVIGECDPLLDEGVAYARRLREAGNAVEQTICEGMFHGFFSLAASLEGASVAVGHVVGWLRRYLRIEAGTAGGGA
jgi:acetyl esterase